MIEGKIRSSRPVALVGGGSVAAADIAAAARESAILVAADGGADAALALGHRPDWAIGDLDSLSAETCDALAPGRVVRDTDPNSTDFDKCVARIDAPRILAVGFLGKRVDHQLAAFNTLVREPAGWIVLIGAHDICVHLPLRLTLDLAPGTRVSLFPLRRVTGRSRGLEWNIDGLHFAPGGQIGTSNRATGAVDLSMDGAGMVLILPRAELSAVLAALAVA
ncbi:thiamine diphosphokinase [Oceaniglobus indicus]|uniref:thiamine diphosphokinase n=1 Tax=Oceaniglobus indicus TaxID=2047749 RepID=UPI000C195FD3|nr:thiamine diphosphokinase [Oceaniglobus indicus]